MVCGQAVTCWRTRQRWVSRAKPRSPRARSTRSSRLLGAAVDVKPLAGFRRQERSVNALASAGVAAVGEGGQTAGGGRVQRAERVRAGGGQVVGGAGFDRRYPDG